MAEINTELIPAINQSLEISLPESVSLEEVRNKLAEHINHLINHDFEKLVYYLYRIDVNENKMRSLLVAKKGEYAAGLISDLIIERQLQKIESRKKMKNPGNISEDEKW